MIAKVCDRESRRDSWYLRTALSFEEIEIVHGINCNNLPCTFLQDIKDAEMEALPKTEDNIPPHLCVLRQGGKVTSAFVVGDTVAVHVTIVALMLCIWHELS